MIFKKANDFAEKCLLQVNVTIYDPARNILQETYSSHDLRRDFIADHKRQNKHLRL